MSIEEFFDGARDKIAALFDREWKRLLWIAGGCFVAGAWLL